MTKDLIQRTEALLSELEMELDAEQISTINECIERVKNPDWQLRGNDLRLRLIERCTSWNDTMSNFNILSAIAAINIIFDEITIPVAPMYERDRLLQEIADLKEQLSDFKQLNRKS